MPIWLCVFKIFYNISYAHFSQLNIGCVYIYYLFLCLFFSPLAISDVHMEGASARRSHTLNSLPLSLFHSLSVLHSNFLVLCACIHCGYISFRLSQCVLIQQHFEFSSKEKKHLNEWHSPIHRHFYIYNIPYSVFRTNESWMLRLLCFCYTSIVSIWICIKCVVFCYLFATFMIDSHLIFILLIGISV